MEVKHIIPQGQEDRRILGNGLYHVVKLQGDKNYLNDEVHYLEISWNVEVICLFIAGRLSEIRLLR